MYTYKPWNSHNDCEERGNMAYVRTKRGTDVARAYKNDKPPYRRMS